VRRLHYALRRANPRLLKIVSPMAPGEGDLDLFPKDAPFRPLPCLLQQGVVADQGTELFRAVVAANNSRQLLEAGSVSTSQDDTPAFPPRGRSPPVGRGG